jgi:hypothetical protein
MRGSYADRLERVKKSEIRRGHLRHVKSETLAAERNRKSNEMEMLFGKLSA